MRRVLFALSALLGVGLACSSFEGSPETTPPVDAGVEAAVEAGPPACTADTANDPANCGACGHACGQNESCTAGQCAPGCPNGTVFVSASGSDQNTGCDQTKPKATIASAIGYVKTLGLTKHEIHVCAGTYTENGITLDYPVTLRGGYECALWQRHAPFAWSGFDPNTGASIFDSTNETIIDAGTATSALTVSGSSATIDSSIAVEGFTIRGNASVGGSALLLVNGTSVAITNNKVLGAAGGTFSIGLHTKDTVASEISHNIIRGGAGGSDSGQGTGSTGVLVESAQTVLAPSIHDNEIGGGTGRGATVSTTGIEIATSANLTGDHALEHNAIIFQGGSATGQISGYGVLTVGKAQVDLVGNGLYGGAANCTVQTCSSFGVYLSGSNSKVIGNRIQLPPGQPVVKPNLYAVYVSVLSSGITIANNLIAYQSGNVFNADAIVVPGAATGVDIVHNTIIVPTGPQVDGISSLGTNVHIDDNLFVGTRFTILSVTAPCIDASNQACTPPATLNNNAFVDVAYETSALSAPKTGDTACGIGAAAMTIPTLQALYPHAANNIAFANSCAKDDATCHPCAAAAGDCFGDVFASPSLAAKQLVSGDLPLSPTMSCALAKGGDANVTTVATDILGAQRTAPTTIGSLEDDTCTP